MKNFSNKKSTSKSNINIISYNINNLPYLTKNQESRLYELKKFIHENADNIDVFVFQEVFTADYISFLYQIFKEINWSIIIPDNNETTYTMTLSGLAIASKYNIFSYESINFRYAKMTDCLAKKGALKANICINNNHVGIINTHIQDADWDDTTGSVRKSQLREIKNNLCKPDDIIVGDINADYNIQLYGKNIFNNISIFPDEPTTTHSNEILDGCFNKNCKIKVLNPSYVNFISDHKPILVTTNI